MARERKSKPKDDYEDDEEKPSFELTGKHVRLLALCIAAIAGFAFLIGFVTAGNKTKGAGQNKDQAQSASNVIAAKPLDSDVTGGDKTAKQGSTSTASQSFTFSKTLDKATTHVNELSTTPVPGKQKADVVPPIPTPVKITEGAKPEQKPEVKPVEVKSGEAKQDKKEAKQEKPDKKEVAKAVAPPVVKPKTQTPSTTATPQPTAVTPATTTQPAVKPQTPSTTTPATPAKAQPTAGSAKPADGKPMTIQVGAFPTKQEAEKLINQLSKKNHFAYIQPFTNNGKTWYRVRVGSYHTESAAKRAAASLQNDEKLHALVVPY